VLGNATANYNGSAQVFAQGAAARGASGKPGGGGPAPLTLGNPTDLRATKMTGVSNANPNAPVIGDAVGVMGFSSPPAIPGNDASAGGGANADGPGDAVFHQDLTPDEQALLQRYYK
jgi:hypothetical protein